MNSFRAISIDVHAALELVAAPLLIVAPFALGFSIPTGILSIAFGVLLIGLATSAFGGQTGRGTLPLTAHANFDYILGAATIVTGLLVGFAVGDYAAGLFLLAFGSAHLGLASSTRYTRPAPLGT
ncbi:hypothetical protein BH20ACT15_BH20ACT15_15260 [soil metagenome]